MGKNIVSIIIILCGIVFLLEANSIRNLGYDLLDTSFFPKLTSSLLIFSGVGLFISNLFKKQEKSNKGELKENTLRIILFVLIFIIYLIILPQLHFISSTILFIMATYLIIDSSWNFKNIIKGLVFSILLSYTLWFVFEKGFNLLLP